MTKNILLLGLKRGLIDDITRQLAMPEIKLFDGTGLEDVRLTFAKAQIDHVFIGGGIDLQSRLDIVREIYRSSDRTTVHLEDQILGPEGYVPFVRSVLLGVKDYEFIASPNARSEIPSRN